MDGCDPKVLYRYAGGELSILLPASVDAETVVEVVALIYPELRGATVQTSADDSDFCVAGLPIYDLVPPPKIIAKIGDFDNG